MSRHKNLVLWSIFAAFGAFFVGKYAVLANTPNNELRPFLIEMQEKVFAGTNPQQLLGEFHFVYAVRQDGSHVYANRRRDGENWRLLSRRIELVAEAKTALVSDVAGLVSSFRMSARRADRLRLARSGSTCEGAGHRITGEEYILGYRVEKLEKDNQAVHIERWVAPDLQCHVLKSRLQKKGTDGTVVSTSEEIATSVRLGEPPTELFEIATHYVESLPSQLYINERTRQLMGPESTEVLRKNLERVDETYRLLKRDNVQLP